MAQRPRGFETMGDMARSLGVTFILIGFILLVTHRDHGDGIRVVDWKPVVARLEPPLLRPASLPEGWRVTSARRESAGRPGLHIGALTRAGRYVGLEESQTGDAAAYLAELMTTPAAAGQVELGGHTWSRFQSSDREGHTTRALLRASSGVAVVVLGTGSWDDLGALVTSSGL